MGSLEELHGENNDSEWAQEIEYEVPQVITEDDGWEIGTIADYFGIPTGVGGLSVNALPFRAYSLIINDWFRDQNLQQPVYIPRDDYRDWETDRKSTRLNSSHSAKSRMPSSA